MITGRLPHLPQVDMRALLDSLHLQLAYQPTAQAVDVELVRRESEALAARDAADSNRRIAPLKPAPDAVLLDTTALTLEAQVTHVVELARQRFPK